MNRPGVDGIFDQFLHDRRRPLDHLARGDAVHQAGGQLLYATGFHGRGL
jgi:hypothetical protein